MAGQSKPDFSVVMATYTGLDTIESSLRSLLNQKSKKCYEVIIIIDGPNEKLRQKVDNFSERFAESKIAFRIEQFHKNKGRFEARRQGALLAKSDYILIVDDRVEVPDDYLEKMAELKEEAAMPDVIENAPENAVSYTLGLIRRRVYGQKWGSNFKPFYIDVNNFDSSAKGTTSFWVNRQKFLQACKKLSETMQITTTSSDDTRLLKYLVESGTKIYKTSKIKIIYNARSTILSEIQHLFHRGPKFIDYYFSPGTRYFFPLLFFFLSLVPMIILVVLFPILLIAVLAISLLFSLWLAGEVKGLIKAFCGLWVVGVVFSLGLVAGLINKVTRV